MPWANGKWQNAKKDSKAGQGASGAASKFETAMLKMADANTAMMKVIAGGKDSSKVSKGNGKGGGAGKGKDAKNSSTSSKGKGKGKGDQLQVGWWQCKDADCLRALRERNANRGPACNPAESKQCWNCLAFKGTEKAVAQATAATAWDTKQAGLRAKVASKPAQLHAAAMGAPLPPPPAPQPATSLSAYSTQHMETPGKTLAEILVVSSPDDAWDPSAMKEIWPATGPLISLLGKEAMPPEWTERRSPEQEVSRLLGFQSTTARLEELTAAKGELTRLESVLYAMGPADQSPEAVGTKAKAEAARAKVQKLEKNAPQTPLERNAVDVALATHEGYLLARAQRVEKATQAAKERAMEREKWFDKVTEQLCVVRDRVMQLEMDKDHAYEDRAREQHEHDQAVSDLLRKKKEELAQKIDQAPMTVDLTQEEQPAEPANADASTASTPQASTLLQEMEKKLKEYQAQIEALRVEAEAAKSKNSELEKEAKRKEDSTAASPSATSSANKDGVGKESAAKDIELDVDLLPAFTCEAPSPQVIAAFEHAFQVLEQVRWLTGVEVTMELLQLPWEDLCNTIGDQLQTVYPERPPAHAALHPQVLRLLHTALVRISTTLTESTSDDSRKNAKERAKESLRAQAKRQRRA